MAYDLSMFNNISARNSPNLAESFSRGMDARKQMDQTNEDRAIKGALKKNMVAGPDGKTSLNREGAFADLAQINPEKAQAMERDYMKQDMEKMSFQANAAKDLAWGIRDQDTYTQARERGLKMGLPGVEKLPEQYDPGLVKQLQYSTLTAQEQLAQQNFDRGLTEKMLDRRESRDERRFQSGIKMEEKQERQIEQDMMKLSKDVGGTQELIGALDEVEKVLGGSVESFENKNGTLYKGKDKVDLPGVSIPGMGRVTAYSSSARDLHGAASRVFNATLKDRSGGAVTDNELERLRTEFNNGQYNTEPEMIGALQRYKRQVDTVMKNREAAYRPEVVERYAEQGGRTSKTVAPVATFSQDVLNYAKNHGISPEQANAIKAQRTSQTGSR